jgi:hypothetical protein
MVEAFVPTNKLEVDVRNVTVHRSVYTKKEKMYAKNAPLALQFVNTKTVKVAVENVTELNAARTIN